MDISYKEVYTMNKEEARRLIIDTYSTTGNLSHTARLWHTSRCGAQMGEETPRGSPLCP